MADVPAAETFDYVIVGAGSAGCVLANRLSADPRKRVLLIEAGGTNDHLFFQVPKGFGFSVNDPKAIWAYAMAKNGREEVWIRGRGLGGSSALNGLVYMRGQPEDYAAWAAAAGGDWDWLAMKAAFRAIEDHELGDDGNRGVGGPLHVEPVRLRDALTERMIAAGEQMGLLRKEDLNEVGDQAGVGYHIQNVKHGRRQSAAVAFLNPARRRPNLKVVTEVHVDRVVIADGRAVAVAGRRNGAEVRYGAGEVILAAGALNSPKLLMLSGIGPGDALSAAGVAVLRDSPSVGRGLREHLGLVMTRPLTSSRGLNPRYRGLGLLQSMAEYALRRSGPLATGPWEVGAFARSDPARARPDVQLLLGASTLAPSVGRGRFRRTGTGATPGMTIYGMLNHLESEAEIRLSGPDPLAPPVIDPNWLATEADRRAAIGMFRFMRRYFQQPALASVVGAENPPTAGAETDEEILAIYDQVAAAGLHAVGSCRMGHDAASVVDQRLRVRGVDGLRVVDCSVMPGLISGNTNGPAMALAWRAADLMLG